MTMQADGEVKVPPAVQTAAAMVLALVTYTMVYYVAISLVLIAEDAFPNLFSLMFMGTRPNAVQMTAALFGAAVSIGAARLVCDLTLASYRTWPVFWMFAGVLGAMTLGKIWAPSGGLQMAVIAQYLAAMAVAYFLFWQEPRPEAPPE